MPGTEPHHGAPADDEAGWVGKIVSGKYAILAKLGTGGMGSVYEAENVAVGRKVALKILSAMGAKHPDAVERFEREARAAGRIGHPNIIDVLDLGRTEDGVPYIVMERLDGEELYALLARAAPLAPALAIEILIPVLSALGAAHAAGIVHRDLKPENVFLVQSGAGSAKVKVLDFGVAKFQRGTPEEVGTRLTRAGSLIGTPSYMSPEQAVGKQDVDATSDLYSAGVLLYEMLSGQLPHPGDNYLEIVVAIASQPARPLAELAPWLHPGLLEVVERAMARRPEDRFQTAADFAAALEPFAEHTEVGVPKRVPVAGRDVSGLRPSAPDGPGPRAKPADREPAPAPSVPPAATSATTAAVAPSTAAAVPIDVRPAPAGHRGSWLIAGAAVIVVLGLAIGTYLVWPAPVASPPDSPAPAEPVPQPPDPAVPVPAAPPEAAPALPATIALDVDSNVPHARVLLDGVLIGETPLHEIVQVRPGEHQLRIEAQGYDAVEQSIGLEAPQRLRVELQRPVTKVRPGKKAGGGLLFHQDVYRDRPGH